MIKFLDLTDVINIHDSILQVYGGLPGIRDKGLLESAVAQASMIVYETFIHEDIFEMAAAYMFHIIKNHAFADGNKRTGLLASIIFLKNNGITLKTDMDTLYLFTISVANSELDKKQIANFFKKISS